MFYTSLGHREDVWTNPTYQAHLLGGILWVLGFDHGNSATGLPKPSNDFVTLFDGRTLSRWTPNDTRTHDRKDQEAGWRVLPGGIVTGEEGTVQGHLFSPKSYENFHYKAEGNIGDRNSRLNVWR